MTRPSDIGRELAALRRARGLTQAQLATAIGVKRQQLQRWEASEYRGVPLERLDAIAEVLGWSDLRRHGYSFAAESPAAYGTAMSSVDAAPVRDLGEVIARIRAHSTELHERFGVTHIDVFGSFARGEQRPDSDVDLLVEVETPTMETVFGAERRLSEILGRRTESGSIRTVNPNVLPRVEAERVHAWNA